MLTQNRKEILTQLKKLDCVDTENHWKLEGAVEYHCLKEIKLCYKYSNYIKKQKEKLYLKLVKSYKVENQWQLPNEIYDYMNKLEIYPERWSNVGSKLTNLGYKLPKTLQK